MWRQKNLGISEDRERVRKRKGNFFLLGRSFYLFTCEWVYDTPSPVNMQLKYR